MRVQTTKFGIIFLIFLPLMLGLGAPGLTEANSCDHVIRRTTTIANGWTDYSEVQPGDTVCLEAGPRNNLKLKSLRDQ